METVLFVIAIFLSGWLIAKLDSDKDKIKKLMFYYEFTINKFSKEKWGCDFISSRIKVIMTVSYGGLFVCLLFPQEPVFNKLAVLIYIALITTSFILLFKRGFKSSNVYLMVVNHSYGIINCTVGMFLLLVTMVNSYISR